MDNVPPLIPNETCPPYADVSPVLREAFQDLFSTATISEPEDDICAKKPGSLSRDDITNAEHNIMFKQAEYLLCQNILEENPDIMDRMHLRQPRLIGSPKEEYRQLYHLLKADDLRGHDYERYFGYNSSNISLLDSSEKTLLGEKAGGDISKAFKPCTDKLRLTPKETQRESFQETRDVFEVIPPIILFHNYEPDVKYVKMLRLRNKTKRVVHFAVRPLGLGQFEVHQDKVATVAPPGLPIQIRIHFRGRDRIGIMTKLHVIVENADDLEIDLIAYRDPPILRGIVLDIEFDLHKATSTISDIPRQSDREKVLNRSIECGSCLLGDFKEVLLLVRNIGGGGRFFIVSEEDWYSSTVNDVTSDGFLVCPPFCMSPVYFSVNPGEVAALQTIFLPRVCGAHVERVLLICDNCTIRGADLLGDGVIFNRNFISIDVPLKDYDITMDGDNDAMYHVDFGEMPLNGMKDYPFLITNMGPVELSFYWEVYTPNIIWTAANPGICYLPLSDLKVVPINGIIEGGESVHFTMTVNTRSYGDFRTCVGLYAGNIPSESLQDPIPESYIQRNSNCDIDRVDVLMASIEVWINCCPADLKIEPCIIDLSCGNITGSHIEFPLYMRNNSDFQTSLEIGYCGPVTKAEEFSEKFETISPPRRSLITEGKPTKIPRNLMKGNKPKPCASMPGKTCSTKCSSRNICKNENNRNVVFKHSEKTRETHSASLFDTKTKSLNSDKQDSPMCVIPKNFLGCDRSVVSLTPVEALIEPLSTLKLSVNLKLDGLQNTHERFVFMSTDGSSPVRTLDIKIRSQRHCLDISKAVIDFGPVKRGIKVSDSFEITKICSAPVCWKLTEYYYNFVKLKFQLCNNRNTSRYKGSLDNKCTSVNIKYNLLTKIYGPMLSIIEIMCWKKQKDICEYYYIIVRAVVEAPIISLTAWNSSAPVLSPNGALFVGIPSNHKVILSNCGRVPVSFMWSQPVGNQAYYLKIQFTPRAAIIQPNESKIIAVVITPKQAGLIDKCFVPCFIGRQTDPLILGIMCMVESIYVTFSIPSELCNGEPIIKTILWSCPESEPTRPLPDSVDNNLISDSDSITSAQNALKEGQYFIETLSPEIEVRTHDLDEASPNTNVSSDENLNKDESEDFKLSYSSGNTINGITYSSANAFETLKDSYWKYLYVDGLLLDTPTLSAVHSDGDKSFAGHLNEEYSSYNTFDSVFKTANPIAPPSKSLKILDSRVSTSPVEIVVLKVLNLQTRTAVKKSITIRNETPLQSQFKVTIEHYKVSTDIDPKIIIDNINAKVYGQQYDEWAHRVPLGQGLIIHPCDEADVVLTEHSCYNIDMWIYADTWGCYHDVLTIHVKGLHPFQVPIVIMAVGYPIHIPISNENKIPVLDFGSYSKNSGTSTKNFLVKNVCGIPITISWHVFMDTYKLENDLGLGERFPFNIVVDIYGTPKSDPDKLLSESGLDALLTDYYGIEVTKEFKVVPSLTEIMPGSTTRVVVQFKPKFLRTEYHSDNDIQDVECTIVGFIRIRSVDKLVEPRLLRMDGSVFKPVTLLGKAQHETKSVCIEILTCDFFTPVSATDVLGTCSRSLKFCQRLLLRNNGDKIKINIETEDPYEITSLKSRDVFVSKRSKNVSVSLPRAGLLEVDVECLLELRHVWAAWELLNKHIAPIYRLRRQDLRKSYVLQRNLMISAGSHMRQTLKMDIEVIFPDLRIYTKEYVLFGPVFVGDSVTSSIVMCNRSSCRINFEVQMKYGGDEIELLTKSGTVFPAVGNNFYSTMIHVKFRPTACRKYSNLIQILTCLPFYNFQIYVAGTGTNDSKHRAMETIVE